MKWIWKSMLPGLTLLLMLGVSPAQTSESKACSDAILKGDYGFTVTGWRPTGPNGSLVQVVGVALTRFDGEGHLTQTDNVNSASGQDPTDRQASGVYSVNPDCSGTMIIDQPGTPHPLQLRIVVVDGGKEVRTAVMNPDVLITSNGLQK